LSDFYDLTEFENYSKKKAAVTLRQLLTMTSGFAGYDFEADSPGNEENMYPQPDWVKWTLNLPMASDRNPGEEWRYFTAGIVVLGDILNAVLPGGLEAYAHKKLFAPLGITNYEWQHTPQHIANTAGGTALTPLDFAKFGEVHRTRGSWGDVAVIPARWVNEALRPGVSTTVPGNRYGYLWWHKTYDVNGQTWPAAFCSGNGGNKIFVFDDQRLVVVVTASAYGQRYMHEQVDEMMTKYILPSVARGRAGE
jgi:CubicO group peptidase (beta-lactamase class C family)